MHLLINIIFRIRFLTQKKPGLARIISVDKTEKQVSSSIGHNLMHNHPFASQRFNQANKHLSPNQQKDKYYTGKEVGVDYGALEAKEPGFMESFMGAAVPNKMKSTVTMPGYEQFQSVNPSEFRSFIDANIEGIPGDLTRQDLANMYEDYNKFTGRPSNYAGAKVPGTVENLFNLIL